MCECWEEKNSRFNIIYKLKQLTIKHVYQLFIRHLKSISDCIGDNMLHVCILGWIQDGDCMMWIKVLVWELKQKKILLSNKFWSARLKMSVANGFSVPLFLNHSKNMYWKRSLLWNPRACQATVFVDMNITHIPKKIFWGSFISPLTTGVVSVQLQGAWQLVNDRNEEPVNAGILMTVPKIF